MPLIFLFPHFFKDYYDEYINFEYYHTARYLNYAQVYRRISIAIIESSFLINLILLFTGISFFRNKSSLLFNISIACAFIEFCGIVIWNSLPQKIKSIFVKKAETESGDDPTQMTNVSLQSNHDITDFETKYRDSILSD